MNSMVIAPSIDKVHHLGDVEYFDPNETLVTTFRRAIANAQDILLELEGVGQVMLLGSRGEYFATLSDEIRFYTATLENIAVTLLSHGDRRLPAAGRVGRDIEELMWKVAYYSSRGRLMQGCYPVDMVELTYWPNLSRLPHSTNSMRIAALLSRHPASVAFVARLLKISAEEMYQFYSAASCAGLARPVNRVPEEPRLEPHRHQTLLSALLKKIAAL